MLAPDGEGDLMCPKGHDKMVARFGPNRNGLKPAWRCYGDVLSMSDTAACTTNEGELTNQHCSDPDFNANTYCNRPDQLAAIFGEGCVKEFNELSDTISSASTCGNEAASSRIFGGVDGATDDWKWMFRIHIADSETELETCGGTIIDDFWVLTCMFNIFNKYAEYKYLSFSFLGMGLACDLA